ncbi:helix-turn-helix transcriptional regulator [Streptomyces sp. NPDC006540]|uniref:helix-turn-helix domain-containing protein n=1 Tax=Streptomyces sp. NPDC006540 TaxID=3155353 RepID=UPI0033A75603
MTEAPMDDATEAAEPTEAFARKLSELRERSGRSYGSLARRVGVGASTLHRYCSGRTVPMEFAPVERLARFCGCRGEELVALHRLWVLADAARGTRQERTAQAAWDTDGDALRERRAEQEEQEQEQPPAVRKSPAPEAGQVVAASPSARSRSRRHTYAAAFGAAVVVLALVLGFGGFTFGPGKQRTTTAEAEGGGPAPLRSADSWPTPGSPSGPPSPPASPATSATASPVPGSPKSQGPVPTGAGAPSPPAPFAGTPFTWVTDDHVWRHGCGHAYVVDRSPADVPPPPVEADAEQWSRALGAGHAGETRVRITVQGKGPEAVVLESLQVRVAARRAPERHNVYRMDSGCGGSLTPRMFDVDLDKSRPVARSVAGNDAGEPIPAVSFPYRVSASDPEVLLVTGRTVTCDCEWYLQLRWSSGGRTGTVRIDDGGRPFRTDALVDGAVHEYDYGSRGWVPSVPASRRP